MTPQLSSIRADGGHLAIHPLEVTGRFTNWRRAAFAVLIVIYLVSPRFVHLDIPQRRFYLLGGTFNAQDFWMVLLLATGFVFSALFVTAWRGRLWCGWACPQTVFLEAVYRPIERLFDGPSTRRKKPRGPRPIATTLKYTAYAAASIGIAHVAAALFVGVTELGAMIREGPAEHMVAFVWTTAFTLILFFNFTWFREQFCVVLCPYGRLQSVMHDRASVTVAYDAGRKDCIDCKKCVLACPTAIDIRDGLQMECLACAQCVDACDGVMDKIEKPRGLIRYASMNELAGGQRRVVRPRLLIYAALACLSLGTLGVTLVTRQPFEVAVARLRGIPFIVEGERVRNQFDVHVVNKEPDAAEFTLALKGPPGLDVTLGSQRVHIESLEGAHVPLVVHLPRGATHGTTQLELNVSDGKSTRQVAVPFVAPR